MEFFIIERDSQIQLPIKLSTIPGFFESGMGQKLDEGDISAMAFILENDNPLGYEDFIFLDVSDTAKHRDFAKHLVIADKLQIIFAEYNPEITFKPFALINGLEKRNDVYWFCKIEPVIEVDNIDANLYPLLVPHGNSHIIRLDMQNETKFAVTLPVVESILRCLACGVTFRKVECGNHE